MKKLQPFLKQKQKNKGQSLMEMMIVVGVLMILTAGAVEFGYLLNQYITLVDGTRAGARYGSNQDPYAIENTTTGIITYDYSYVQPEFYTTIATVVDYISDDTSTDTVNRGAIAPLVLRRSEDELMIYFLSVREGQSYEVSYIWCQFGCGPKHPRSQALVNSNGAFIRDSLDLNAPNTGLVVVEIFYAYEQLLSLPIFTAFIPDPIQVHAYSIMPLSAAEPTPVVAVTPAVIAGKP